MRYLLIIAHGSRRAESNEEVVELAQKVAQALPDNVHAVKAAFLELASPTIEDAIDDCFQSGASELLVLPYFLSSGNHVVTDIPREIEQAMQKWPSKKLKTLEHIGAMDAIVDLIQSKCKSGSIDA